MIYPKLNNKEKEPRGRLFKGIQILKLKPLLRYYKSCSKTIHEGIDYVNDYAQT